MQIRCPHCQNGIDLVDDSDFQSIDCDSCGSQFGLVDVEQNEIDTLSKSRGTTATIGHFELIEEVGRGAFGTVWRARDAKLDRQVAIKIPRGHQISAEDREQFLREARAAAQLSHPNIVTVYEVGRDGEQLYIVSDFVEGVTLAEKLTAQRLAPREAVALCVKIAAALEHAHANGVIHRDLKPSNIMLTADDEPRVMDFGLAKRDAGEITMTVEGKVLGTPAYMPPEQARGEGHHVDRRADVYSLGVILYELLSGELPFRGATRMLLQQVIHEEAPSPRKLNNSIPRDLETICLKCLEKEPGKRYETCAALAEDLRHWSEGKPIKARRTMLAMRIIRWCKRKPLAATLLVTVASLVAMILAVGLDYFAKDLLQQVIAELDQQDPNWRLDDIEANRQKIPLAENAAPRILAASEKLQSDPNDSIFYDELWNDPTTRLSTIQLNWIREQIETNAMALDTARSLSRFQDGRFEIEYSRDGFSTYMPHLTSSRAVARMLDLDAMLAVHSDDMKHAMESWHAMMVCAQAIGDEPPAVSQLVRIAITHLGILSLERVISHGELSEMELVTCQTLIEKEQRHPFLTIVFRGERGMSHWALTEAGVRGKNFLDNEEFGFGNDPQTTALQGEKLRQAHARLLQRMTELLEILQSPSQELLSKCRQWDIETEESDRHLLATAAAAALVKANHINKTRIACTAMALAAERYRLETGKWPDTLSALVPRFIDIVLSDPFEGLPLRYLQLSDGIVIYSPGFDGEDNGGVLGHMATNDPHTDIGFKLLDLNKRHGDSGSP